MNNTINAVAISDWNAVKAGTVYAIRYDNGLIDGEQYVDVYDCWNGEHIAHVKADRFSRLDAEQ